MKKRNMIICIIVVAIILVGLFLASGGSRTDVFLKDYEISQDGKTMTLKVGVSSSAGYIRKMKRTSGSTNYYYTFYSTFGINSKTGAKDTFEIELDQNVDEIYFYTGGKGYKKVLEKNANGEWIKVENYDLVTSLEKNEKASTEVLVKFDGVLYGKSNAIIDYAGNIESERIGIIDRLVDSKYVPKFDNETNTKEILNAEVYNKTEDSIVLFYNNEYVLFGKIK
ncbi:MAG: hypothetical protein IJO32_00080 [Bacilli bacterium]|nr:hypothetical protein [Bacilli bacterium]MBQ7139882.1 hypothetical protein [Bacilli bacterium]